MTHEFQAVPGVLPGLTGAGGGAASEHALGTLSAPPVSPERPEPVANPTQPTTQAEAALDIRPIFAIDPGFLTSGAVLYYPYVWRLEAWHSANRDVLVALSTLVVPMSAEVAIEGMTNQDARAGGEVIETCVWIGRFAQACEQAGRPWRIVPRAKVKSHFNARNDADIRAAILDRFGPQYETRVVERTGKKGQPLKPKRERVPLLTAPLSNHTWPAFALAAYVADQLRKGAV